MLGYIFEHITCSACLERLEKVLRVLVYGYKNHASSLALLLDSTARGEPIHSRHAHIDQGKIRLQTMADHQCLTPIGCLAYDLQTALTSEHDAQASPGELVVIGNHQT